jgi:sulfatase modifying factor 1
MQHPPHSSDSVPPLASTTFPRVPRLGPSWTRLLAAGLLGTLALGATGSSARVAEPPPAPAAPPAIAAEDPAASAPPAAPPEEDDAEPSTLEEQRARLFARMRRELALGDDRMQRVEAIFAASPVLGQGNPAITRHPMTRAECRRIRAGAGLEPPRANACGAPNMVPMFDPAAGQTEADARVCVDAFEFPDIPCEYPVVHVRAREAAQLCRAVGKRICDAHEWEGACAGALRDPEVEYEWARPRKEASWYHNYKRSKVWSYGPTKAHGLCATESTRTPGCPGGGWTKCGSNTYPAGAFPACQSAFGAFDLHGNVAEHMNLPTLPGEMARHGDGGFTEMKGSWFVFSTIEAHEDDCRWREPAWHETRLLSEASHVNYHLGFRCCKDVDPG